MSLPSDWKVVHADDIAAEGKAIVSGPFGSNIGKRFFVESGVPVIRGSNLSLGVKRFVEDAFVYLTEQKAAEFKNCEAIAGDLIFTAAGTLGQVGIIQNDSNFKRYIISNKQLRIRPNKKIAFPLYLYYWFASPDIRNHIIGLNTGSSVPLISLGKLRSVPINLPPLSTQRKIASILSAYDDLIENNTRRIAILDEMAQTIYREWFVNFRFPGHENVKLVDSSLGQIPEGWLKPLGQVVTLKRGYDLPQKDRRTGKVPIVSSSGVTDYHDTSMVEGPGVVTGRYGTLGKVFFVEQDFWPLNTSLYVRDFHGNEPLLVVQLLRSLDLANQNAAGAVPGLNRNALHMIEVVFPPNELQDEIAPVIYNIENQSRILRTKNENLLTTRDLLLPKLISGKLNVEDLDIDLGMTAEALEEAIA